MKIFEYVIKDELGIHARPAGLLVKCAKATGSIVKITKNDKTVEATKLIPLMSMGVGCGDTVSVSIESGDEETAFKAVKEFFEKNL
jgi:phosphocarrier protein HPr